MKDRRTTYSVANLQGEVFLTALEVVMRLPGDWHTGLNMAQPIYTFFYEGFLDEFQNILSWKRIYKDVSKSYFQSVRLLTFVFDELMRFFTHQYISDLTLSDS